MWLTGMLRPQFPASFLNFQSLIRVAPVLLPGGQASPRGQCISQTC